MEKYTIPCGKFGVTIGALTANQLFRMSLKSQESAPPAPIPPEGYDHNQAIELIEEYKREVDNHQTSLTVRSMTFVLGLARTVALDNLLVEPTENDEIDKFCRRYGTVYDHSADAPELVGNQVMGLLDEAGMIQEAFVAYAWLQSKVGVISASAVDDIIKSVRHPSERQADPGQVEGDPAQEKVGEKAADHSVKPAGRRQRGAKVGNATKSVR